MDKTDILSAFSEKNVFPRVIDFPWHLCYTF